MKTTLAIIIALALAGCTANIRKTDINFEAGRDMKVDAAGATNTTDTGQLATADLKALVDAAKAAISTKTAGVIDQIKAVIGGGEDESDIGVAASPAGTGTVEEVE